MEAEWQRKGATQAATPEDVAHLLAREAPQVAARRLRKKTKVVTVDPAERLAANLLGTAWRREVHPSHTIAVTADLAFCASCARHSSTKQRLRQLKQPCPRDAAKPWVQKLLARLRAGKPPPKAAKRKGETLEVLNTHGRTQRPQASDTTTTSDEQHQQQQQQRQQQQQQKMLL